LKLPTAGGGKKQKQKKKPQKLTKILLAIRSLQYTETKSKASRHGRRAIGKRRRNETSPDAWASERRQGSERASEGEMPIEKPNHVTFHVSEDKPDIWILNPS
jgi:hypothetical protein